MNQQHKQHNTSGQSASGHSDSETHPEPRAGEKRDIAFLGTGIMGAPMAMNLLRAGHRVACYNRTRAKTEPVVEAGGRAFNTPAEAAREADIIITIVTDSPDVEAVIFGPEGALQTAREGALWIDMSTIAPAQARGMAERAAARKIRALDAPVTGGEIGAESGALSIMVGGAASDLEEARPVLAAMGQTITHCGGHGAGQSVKLCNQICGALNLLGVCEALVLCRKMGIDQETMLKVVGAGAGNSWAVQTLAPRAARGDFAPGFMIDTQLKDCRLIAEAAAEAGVPTLGATVAQQLWRAAQSQGMGQDGIQSLYKVIARMSDISDASDSSEGPQQP
jgi:3-hydroxyisobutyrate dehydrogenase